MKKIFEILFEHEYSMRRNLCLIPSENVLSPCARIPFVLDAYSRYVFDHHINLGQTFFFSGKELSQIEHDVLIPLLQDASCANFVDARPISGLNCMTIVLSSLCRIGDIVLSLPESGGGHMSLAPIVKRMGGKPISVLMVDHEIDTDDLAEKLKKYQPKLFYIDQSTVLFPLNIMPIREIVEKYSPRTIIYFDASHLNGLILTNVLPNPLLTGAHCFGGSTHKTLPGPHKAFFATNDPNIFREFQNMAHHLISHRHIASTISLAITMTELKECGGKEYAENIVLNAKRLAEGLERKGLSVGKKGANFTDCHQVWVSPRQEVPAALAAQNMCNFGLRINLLPSLPGMNGPSFRLSVAEITRLGAKNREIDMLVDIFGEFLSESSIIPEQKKSMVALKEKLKSPKYCYTRADLSYKTVPSKINEFLSWYQDNW